MAFAGFSIDLSCHKQRLLHLSNWCLFTDSRNDFSVAHDAGRLRGHGQLGSADSGWIGRISDGNLWREQCRRNGIRLAVVGDISVGHLPCVPVQRLHRCYFRTYRRDLHHNDHSGNSRGLLFLCPPELCPVQWLDRICRHRTPNNIRHLLAESRPVLFSVIGGGGIILRGSRLLFALDIRSRASGHTRQPEKNALVGLQRGFASRDCVFSIRNYCRNCRRAAGLVQRENITWLRQCRSRD